MFNRTIVHDCKVMCPPPPPIELGTDRLRRGKPHPATK